MKDYIERSGYDASLIGDDGNRFLIGNGYAGIRGTMEEDRKDRMVGITLAGIYDQVGKGWREPVNAPNFFYTCLYHQGKKLVVDEKTESHSQKLNYRYGIRERRTSWKLSEGIVTLTSRRIAHMVEPNLFMMEYELEADGEMTLNLSAGIDGDVWDIHGPHYAQIMFSREDGIINANAYIQNSNDKVCVTRSNHIRQKTKAGYEFMTVIESSHKEEQVSAQCFECHLSPGSPIVLRSYAAVFSSKDSNTPAKSCYGAITDLGWKDYDRLLKSHMEKWDDIWDRSEVVIDGDSEAQEAVNYSLYHLNIIAPRHKQGLSIAARGLSAQTYKGAVFWDTEMFIEDYFLFSQPEVARSFVKYRVDGLKGALKKARSYGFEGAFYAWESQEEGEDACSDYNVIDVFTERPVRTYFRDKQMHISSAVVWGMKNYMEHTGDTSLLLEGGARMVIECARFYRSLLIKRYGHQQYEIHDVIGPDEYHERVNNNAYTNKMAAFTVDYALEVVQMVRDLGPDAYDELKSQVKDLENFVSEISDLAPRILQKEPNAAGVIEQHDGYFKLEDTTPAKVKKRLKHPKEYWGGGHGVATDTQVIKQADVIAMLSLFHDSYTKDILERNFDYYEPRTEHGSSLSACMYAMVACKIGKPDLAYPFFMKSGTADIRGGGKQWAGLVYIGGTHPASAGGAWKNLIQGFAGLSIVSGQIQLDPCLPEHFKAIEFPLVLSGKLHRIKVTHDSTSVQLVKRLSKEYV